MNLQTILTILFSQRGRWVRMVEREKKKQWETSPETLKPLTRCVWRTRKLPLVSGVAQHTAGNTYIKPCSIRRSNGQHAPQDKQLQRGPQHRQQTQQVSVLNSCRINTPFLSPSFRSQTFRTKAAPDHLLLLQPLHRRLTLSQHVPDTSVSFSYIWTFLFSGYLQKYHLGLCIHTPSSSVLTFRSERVLHWRTYKWPTKRILNWPWSPNRTFSEDRVYASHWGSGLTKHSPDVWLCVCHLCKNREACALTSLARHLLPKPGLRKEPQRRQMPHFTGAALPANQYTQFHSDDWYFSK